MGRAPAHGATVDSGDVRPPGAAQAPRRADAGRGGRPLFLGLSADLEYLTGIERGIPFFGQSSYVHGWVTGAFFRPDAEPTFVLPRMVAVFDLRAEPEGEVVVVDETDDGHAVFEQVVRGLGPAGRVAVGDRVWAETTIHLGRVVGLDRSAPARARQRAPAREDRGGARGDDARVPTVTRTMDAVAPRVVPGVTMDELREEVELELRRAGSLTPSFPTHVFTGTYAGTERATTSGSRSGTSAARRGRRRSCSTSAGWSTATAPTSAARCTAANRTEVLARTRRCSPPRRRGVRPRAREPWPAT